jgi:hypothetical protein
MKDSYKFTYDKKDRESLQTTYEGFKKWYIETYGKNTPSRKEFQAYIQNLDKIKLVNGIIIGIKYSGNDLGDEDAKD